MCTGHSTFLTSIIGNKVSDQYKVEQILCRDRLLVPVHLLFVEISMIIDSVHVVKGLAVVFWRTHSKIGCFQETV